MQATVPSSPIVPALPPRPSNKKFLPDSTIPPLLPPRPASSAPPLPSRPSRVDDLQGKEKEKEKEKEKNKDGHQYSSDEIRTRIPPLPPRPNGSGIQQTPPPLPPHSPVPPLPPRPQQDGILLDLSFDEDSEEKKQENDRYLSILVEALKPSAASPVVSDRENQPEEQQQADQQPLTPTTDEKEDEDDEDEAEDEDS